MRCSAAPFVPRYNAKSFDQRSRRSPSSGRAGRSVLILPYAPPAGGRVALVAAAGPLGEGAIERAGERVRSLGWTPVVGRNAAERHGYLAGPDEGRLADLNEALESVDVDAIWLLRGGYGTMRILPRVQLDALRSRPRPLIGFRDNTALHLAAQRLGVVTFHGPHPAASDLSEFSVEMLRLMLRPEPAGRLPFPAAAAGARPLVGGSCEGRLVGGNLALLAATVGTEFELVAEGAILFVEDVGEPAYRLDRLLSQLLLAGLLERVAGIAVGAISESPDSETPDIPDPAEVVLDRLSGLRVPVAYGFPFGHIPESWTLPLGVRARLDASSGTLDLLEPAVRPAQPPEQ